MRSKVGGFFAWLIIVTIVASIFIAASDDQSSNTLTEEQKRAIVARLHTEVLFGQLLYNLPQILPPSVEFWPNLPGDDASMSSCNPVLVSRGETVWFARINETLAARNWDAYLNETIPHEAAHFILCQAGSEDWSNHGARWETTVRDIGATPVALHTY